MRYSRVFVEHRKGDRFKCTVDDVAAKPAAEQEGRQNEVFFGGRGINRSYQKHAKQSKHGCQMVASWELTWLRGRITSDHNRLRICALATCFGTASFDVSVRVASVALPPTSS